MDYLHIKDAFTNATRIVLKVGSDLMVEPHTGRVRRDWLSDFVEDIKYLHSLDKEVVAVMSGAVAMGRYDAGFSVDQRLTVDEKQLAATWGHQHHTMEIYNAFCEHDVRVASGLLIEPSHIVNDNRDRNNFRRNINHVLSRLGVPVVNENDAVANEELKFGNNDVLCAHVASIIDADLMVILSDVDGLYDRDPKQNADAHHVPYINKLDNNVFSMASSETNASSTGGMSSKLEAVRIAWDHSCNAIIANGNSEGGITALANGQARASLFCLSKM